MSLSRVLVWVTVLSWGRGSFLSVSEASTSPTCTTDVGQCCKSEGGCQRRPVDQVRYRSRMAAARVGLVPRSLQLVCKCSGLELSGRVGSGLSLCYMWCSCWLMQEGWKFQPSMMMRVVKPTYERFCYNSINIK